MISHVVFLLSIGLQLAAATFALLLIRVTGWKLAWIVISLAIALMAWRRSASYASFLATGKDMPLNISEVISLVVSGLMLLGVLRIGGYFRIIRSAETARKRTEEAIHESEERYKDILENANDLIQSVDREGRFIYVNRKWLEILGYTKEEADRMTFTDILHKDRIPHCTALLEEVSHGNAVDQVETVFITKNGKDVIVEGSINAVFKNGEFAATRGIFRDITERRQTEAFIKDILDNVGEGFIVIDREYRIISANKAFCDQVKMAAEEIKGRHCYEVSHQILKPCFDAGEDCTVKRTFETGAPHTSLHTHYDTEGNAIYVETKSYPMKDTSGRIVSVIEIMNDVTEKKKLEDQLRHVQKMDAIGQLAGGVAHDFNNILTAIMGYGNILQMKMSADDPLRAFVDSILMSSEKAANLTQSLLAFSRKQIINPKPVRLSEIIKRVEKLLLRIIGEDIELNSRISEEEMTVLADSGQIEQVLMNLATNARDAMPDGGSLTITTEPVKLDRGYTKTHAYAKSGMYALIEISDTGVGIDRKTQERIFEPFFTTKETGKGTGLGLSIVYGIVKQHNGYINVYSEPGRGTTFKIYLPMIKSEVEEAETADPAPPKGGTETLLVAEDNTEVRRLAKAVLEDFGYSVIEAVDGQDAIEKFREHRDEVRMLVLDVLMPNKNGKEAYDEIRKERPDIKVLFSSGYSRDIVEKKGILSGRVNFISKPLSPRELLEKVREILDR